MSGSGAWRWERLPGCWGMGVCAGWRVLRVAESTVAGGARELGSAPADRVRAVGAGRKRLRERDPGLVPALLALVEPDQRGDPESRCAGR
jgi:hypothetical protein